METDLLNSWTKNCPSVQIINVVQRAASVLMSRRCKNYLLWRWGGVSEFVRTVRARMEGESRNCIGENSGVGRSILRVRWNEK